MKWNPMEVSSAMEEDSGSASRAFGNDLLRLVFEQVSGLRENS